ncbi:MAG: hypothetical protein AAB599_01405 [Patescibacteria group bacterium]
MQKIVPHLWFDKEAVEQYEVDLLANTALGRRLRKHFSKAYNDARVFHKESFLLINKRIKYLTLNDFDFIRRQLKSPITIKS